MHINVSILMHSICNAFLYFVMYQKNMQSNSVQLAIRYTAADMHRVDALVNSGFAASRTDYIRRAVREQIIRDAESLKN